MTADEHHPHPHWIGTGHEVRARIEHALRIRSATPGTATATLEQVVKDAGARVWGQLKKRPSIGVVAVGVAGLAVASVVGVGEVAIGFDRRLRGVPGAAGRVSPGERPGRFIEEIAKVG